MAAVSEPLIRVDAEEKASGSAVYLADMHVPGMLHARIVRSTRARAFIKAVHYPEMPPGYCVVDSRDIPPAGPQRHPHDQGRLARVRRHGGAFQGPDHRADRGA